MTLAQQIQTLQGRGLMIADTNKAEQALDAISYFRLADYWYHLEADHHTHQFLPNSHFEEVLTCYFFDKDLKALLFKAIQTIEDCWLGGGVIVCPGVTIGDRCIIGAGSVVVKDIPSDSMAVGNPCRVIRKL